MNNADANSRGEETPTQKRERRKGKMYGRGKKMNATKKERKEYKKNEGIIVVKIQV